METDRLLSISEFSRLSGVSRKNLIFYDEIGVFSPAVVGKNRYRYYSQRQLQTIGVVWALREINVPLKEIKTFLDRRTPRRLVDMCRRQRERVEREVGKLERILELIHSFETATEAAAAVRPGTIALQTLPAARLFMGPVIALTDTFSIDNSLAGFYALCEEKGLVPAHPLGTVTSRASLRDGRSFSPHRFYCPAGDAAPESMVFVRPGGRYAVGYAHGDYGKLDSLYRRLLRFIGKKGLRIQGDAYEEYVLNEVSVRDPERFLAWVAIPVA